MSTNSVRTQADPERVFAVLDDAYAYPRRVRYVDAEWPDVGSRFHYAVGTAVGEIHDSSKVLERDRPHHVALEVRFRPLGVARVDLNVASRTALGAS